MSRKTPKIDRHNVNQWSKSLRPNLNGIITREFFIIFRAFLLL